MTTQTRARYMNVSVSIDTPDAPRVSGRPVTSIAWSATRNMGPVEFRCYAHHPDDGEGGNNLTVLLCTKSLASPDLPAWVPRPPAGWLASLRMTAEPDRPYAGSPIPSPAVFAEGGVL